MRTVVATSYGPRLRDRDAGRGGTIHAAAVFWRSVLPSGSRWPGPGARSESNFDTVRAAGGTHLIGTQVKLQVLLGPQRDSHQLEG